MSSFQLNKAFPLTSAFHTGQEIQPFVSFLFGALNLPFSISCADLFFSSAATTFALSMGAFPRQTGIRVRFLSVFLFTLSSAQQVKSIEYSAVFAGLRLAHSMASDAPLSSLSSIQDILPLQIYRVFFNWASREFNTC